MAAGCVDRIVTGDCLKVMPRIAAMSVDLIFTSPPYPGIRREYGQWTEAEWLTWMQGVVKASDRLLAPKGSMVFVIGPNCRQVGRLAPWPYQFVLDIFAMGLNVVQDSYWVKACRIPGVMARHGLMRDAVEWCVWIGPPDCYRDQKAVLWEYSESMRRLLDLARRGRLDNVRHRTPSGASVNRSTFAIDRGGATPMNALVTLNARREAMGHPAAFSEALASFWIRYACPPGGLVLDPFAGSGTTCAVAKRLGRHWIGIERVAGYARKARQRIAETAVEAA